VWAHTEKLKGFGYVDFNKEESAVIAVKKSKRLSIGGRPLIVDFETSDMKGSFKRNEAVVNKKQAAAVPGVSSSLSAQKQKQEEKEEEEEEDEASSSEEED
jgi:RNA recognition motif-containing protein